MTKERIVPLTYIEFEARSTSYRIAIVHLPPSIAEREGASELLVVLSPRGHSYCLQPYGGFLHWTYIAEKTGLGETDARTVAFLASLKLGREAERPEWITDADLAHWGLGGD